MSPTTAYAFIALAAGFVVPILAALNGALGQRIGSPVAASVILFLVATLVALSVMLLTSSTGHLAKASIAPRHLFLGGVLVAFYILSVTFVAPRFGVGNAVFFILLGQLISAAAIDHFGLFGAKISPFSLLRATGISLMAAGVWLTQQA